MIMVQITVRMLVEFWLEPNLKSIRIRLNLMVKFVVGLRVK